jgi:putative membrane protein
LSSESIGDTLAGLNALLNASSAILLLAGYRLIRRREVRRHRVAMLGAVAASGLFLLFYLLRTSLTGTHDFAGTGAARVFYFFILLTHMVLAVLIVPLIARLLYLALKSRYHAHARLARWTFPLWLYVSVTGLLVYLLLYHVYGYV